MRVIRLDSAPILSLLSTSHSDFAMWVRVGHEDVPTSLQVTPKKSSIGLKFIYPRDTRVWTTKASGDVQMYCSNDNNKIIGFEIPGARFHKELQNLIMWLRQEQKNINFETLRNNYRIVSAFLQMKADEIFRPPQ